MGSVMSSAKAALPDCRVDRGQGDQWNRWVGEGVRIMTSHVGLHALDAGTVGSFRLTDASGDVHEVAASHTGETVIAVFSRYCVPSRMQLKQLDALAKRLMADGVRFMAIAREDPSPELGAFLKAQGIEFAYHYDVDHELTAALDVPGTPTYVVLDRDGRPRFRSHNLEHITRQVWLIRTQPRAVSEEAFELAPENVSK